MNKYPMIILTALCGLIGLTTMSCQQNSYSAQLKAEKQLIETYIKHNNIQIVHEEPADYMNWPENVYLEIGDYCYFHLTHPGDTTTEALERGNTVLMRYRRYDLTDHPDTLSYWNTNELAYPLEFRYGYSSTSACSGWQLALPVMKYSGAEGKLICPSKLGFQNDGSSVTPYGYDLKMQIKRF